MTPLNSGFVPSIPISAYMVWYTNKNSIGKYHENGQTSAEDHATSRSYLKTFDSDIIFSSRYNHVFCGEHTIEGAWCPNCKKPLLRFFNLDLFDPRIGLLDSRLHWIPLLYCWTCNITTNSISDTNSEGEIEIKWYFADSMKRIEPFVDLREGTEYGGFPFMYQVIGANEVRLLQYGQGRTSPDFPYRNYPEAFPGTRASLLELDLDAQSAIAAENRHEQDAEIYLQMHPELDMPRHQIGGEPYLIQKDINLTMRCPFCRNLMPRLGAIGDDCLDIRGFTGNPFVQVIYHYCTACAVVGCFNQCD